MRNIIQSDPQPLKLSDIESLAANARYPVGDLDTVQSSDEYVDAVYDRIQRHFESVFDALKNGRKDVFNCRPRALPVPGEHVLDEVDEPGEHVLSGLHIVTHEVECALERSTYYSCERAEMCLQRNDCYLNQSRYNVNQWR